MGSSAYLVEATHCKLPIAHGILVPAQLWHIGGGEHVVRLLVPIHFFRTSSAAGDPSLHLRRDAQTLDAEDDG
jgi:hypothetical protein